MNAIIAQLIAKRVPQAVAEFAHHLVDDLLCCEQRFGGECSAELDAP